MIEPDPASDAAARRDIVLVVDDTPESLSFLTDTLESEGITVLVATGGEACLTLVDEITPDLILMDINMPRMNGIELVKRIRADQRLQGLPVVIVSYKDREEDRIRGLEAGATHYLAKAGFQDSTLVTVVRDLIGEAVEA